MIVESGALVPEVKDPAHYLREALRKPAEAETQVEGTLVRLDCDAKGITFAVKVGERLLKLHAESFEQLDITTFSSDVAGEITCGPRKPENRVVVCYVPASDGRKVDGTIKSLEFVPQDFKLKG